MAGHSGNISSKIERTWFWDKCFFLWILNFVIGFAFPILLSSVGLSFTFFIFVALGVLAIGFVYKFMPETKGRTLEELEEHFRFRHDHNTPEQSVIKV